MKTITFMSFKGGAGKTTALYLLTAALNERGKRVALVNADPNDVLHQWRMYGISEGTWDDENVKIWKIFDVEGMSEAGQGAEDFNADYIIIDTAGGGNDLNDAIVYNSDVVVIPTDLGRQELDQTLETMKYVQDYLREQEALHVLNGFLLNRVPLNPRQYSADERAGWEIMKNLPIFDTVIPDRKLIKSQKTKGLMNLHRDKLNSNKWSKFQAPDYTKSLKFGHQLADELDAVLADNEAVSEGADQ